MLKTEKEIMTDFSSASAAVSTPLSTATPTSPSAQASAAAATASAVAAASLIHSASQINELSGHSPFSSLAQVCQYGSRFAPSISDHHASIYTAGVSPEAAAVAAASQPPPTSVSTSTMASVAASTSAIVPLAPLGFTQEQVACVCEVLEQSGNIERLGR